ncbi:MAG: HD domain-containing protein [Myxococcota bacterium]
MDLRSGLPGRVRELVAHLAAADVPVFLVGGGVRDLLLGRPIRDIDLVVGRPLDALQALLPEATRIDAATPVLLLREDAHAPRIEITTLRGPVESLEADLRERDFTLNAIAFDLQQGRWIDPLGGRHDLEARRLRAANLARSFRADPLRIQRGVRLGLELDLSLDPPTGHAMEHEAWRLAGVAGERRRDELLRMLELALPSRGLEQLRELGALAALLPELLREVAVAQSAPHREDVYAHTLRVCDLLRPAPRLRLAALLHDAGKPETKRRRADGRFSFHRHEQRGVRHVERCANRLRLSRRDRSRIAALVRHHLLFPERLESEKALRRMLHRVGRDILPELLELRRADLAARDPDGRPPPEWSEVERRIRALDADEPAEPKLAIGGKEIMHELGIGEGPEVGRWLRRLRRRVLEHPHENQRERLRAWLREGRRED